MQNRGRRWRAALEISRQGANACASGRPEAACDDAFMSSAHELSARLADLLRNERTALAEFLIALADFDRKRLWVDLDRESLFSFLTRDLGLSAGAAYYRKTAAEVLEKFPEVIEPLRDGRLCFTSIVELAKNITPENRNEILPRFFHVSKRQAKAITAELQPAQVVPRREVVSRVLAAPPAPTTEAAPALGIALHPGEVVRANSEPAPQEGAPRREPPRMSVDPLTAEESRLHLTVSRRLLDKLEQARAALSHSHPGASTDAIFEVGLDLIIERHAKRRGLVKNPRKKPTAVSTPASSPTPVAAKARARYVPAAIRRAIWKRDQGKCQWPTHDGGICGSTCRVELDHAAKPFAKGGRILKPEDGRLLCRHHQDVSAREVYGDEHMNNYTKPKGPTCSEPIAEYGAARIPPSSGEPRSRVSRTTRSRFPRAAPPRLEPFPRCPDTRHHFGSVARAPRGRRPREGQASSWRESRASSLVGAREEISTVC